MLSFAQEKRGPEGAVIPHTWCGGCLPAKRPSSEMDLSSSGLGVGQPAAAVAKGSSEWGGGV